MTRDKFYQKQILRFIKNKNSKILVLGAGALDKKIFKELDYSNVVYSNIENTTEKNLNHFTNIHDIKFNDEQFDFCVAHACIHHSSKPHSAILELYRVSSKGALIIEAQDSLLSRLACKLNLSEEFELSAVEKNKVTGGVDNTDIPNYVYRWTEREIQKLMKSYKPQIKHNISFDYGHQIKFTNLSIIKFFFKVFFLLFRKQQNLFSVFIEKDIENTKYNKWYKKK
jgi:ubiquinone/menaquinone biosynthesis C-methylase UbiE